jgi:hypothetical protein
LWARPGRPLTTSHPSAYQKQKKRSKAALDEAYASIYSQQPHPHILKLDYMSSECSSEGDDAGLDHGRLPEGEWERRSGRDPNPELNKGKGEKVLEIRTPRWRSERVRSRPGPSQCLLIGKNAGLIFQTSRPHI